MLTWVLSSEQLHPTDVEQVENYKRNGNNEYLAVIKQQVRRTQHLFTVPVNLWLDNETKDYYWSIVGTDERVVPEKWAMMPEPC